MKKLSIIFFAFVVVVACTVEPVPVHSIIEKKGIESQQMCNINNFVTLDNVESILSDLAAEVKSSCPYYISPFLGEKEDTVFYIVNYEGNNGWKIFSSDMRTPPVLAESSTGVFSPSDNPNIEFWLSCMAGDIEKVRSSKDKDLAFSEEEIMYNRTYWTKDTIRFRVPVTKPGDEGGHWEYYVTQRTIPQDSVLHMNPHWDQEEPYNQYCPLKSDNSGLRAPAGCIAIAGAGTLYYLHKKLGHPEYMVSNGYCYGDINNYSSSFDTPSATVWNQMDSLYHSSLSYDGAEAIMIGYVGSLTGMNYNNEYSWTFPVRLKTNVFEPLGFSCSSGDYNENIAKESLLNNIPVIVTASNLLIPIDFDIHCFALDGYKCMVTEYTNHYYWVQDEFPSSDPGVLIPIFDDPEHNHPGYSLITYSNPYLSEIKINWGWASQWAYIPVNDGWYTLTGSWVVQNGNDTYDYNHNRSMIYGFQITQ